VKSAGILIGVFIATAVGFVIWERSRWTKERGAQCASAQPLISASAPKQRVFEVLGRASLEYGRADWAEIEKHFGSAQQGEKVNDISSRLHDRGRLLVYSRSNSIMFLYLDPAGRASHASCFLQ
jgi:hypothetical protein